MDFESARLEIDCLTVAWFGIILLGQNLKIGSAETSENVLRPGMHKVKMG